MALLANSIGLGQPGGDFAVNLLHALETKRVQMISGRERLDPPKARIFQAAREHDMAVHPIPPDYKRRETHPDVKRDPRFLGQDADRAVLFRNVQQPVEDCTHLCRLAGEM